MSRPTKSEYITLSTLRDIYGTLESGAGFESAIQRLYNEHGAYGVAVYLNTNRVLPKDASYVFSFLKEKSAENPAAINLFKHALRINARNNSLDFETLEKGIDSFREFMDTATISDVRLTCELPGATPAVALENEPHAAPPETRITTPSVTLAETGLGPHDDREEMEFEVTLRTEHCDALRLLVKNCLELGLSKEVDEAIALARKLDKPSFLAIAELCKKEAAPTNAPGATDGHAWQLLRNRLSGTAIEVEAEVAQ